MMTEEQVVINQLKGMITDSQEAVRNAVRDITLTGSVSAANAIELERSQKYLRDAETLTQQMEELVNANV